jgi:hypothetical protein
VFLKGFSEAIGIAVALVAVYLALNVVVVVVALSHVIGHPVVVGDWTTALTGKYSDPLVMVGIALLVFPKLALGLSGFETGVAVMPLVRGAPTDTEQEPGRPYRRRPPAAHHRRADHERVPRHDQLRHHSCSSRPTSSSPAAPRTGGRWRTWPTNTWAARSARSTTSRRSRSSGSPARRRWPDCSTSSRATCPGTAWRRTGPAPSAR